MLVDRHRPAVHPPQEPGGVEIGEVAPDRRDAGRDILGKLPVARRAPRAQRIEDPVVTLFPQHPRPREHAMPGALFDVMRTC